MTTPGACVSKRPDNDPQRVLPRIIETQKITPFDHLREAVLHAHADMRVAIKMQRRGLLLEAWQKVQQGHDRLGKALDTVNPCPVRQDIFHDATMLGAPLFLIVSFRMPFRRLGLAK